MIVEIARASCDLDAKISQNGKATVRRPYDAAYDGFTGYDDYGESVPRRPYRHRANLTIFTSYGAVTYNRSICRTPDLYQTDGQTDTR